MKRCKFLKVLEISPAFVAFLCAYYYFDPAHTFTPFVTAVILHEAGHLLVLKLLGVRIHKLCLTASGAIMVTAPLPYTREILVAAAGPAVNLTLLILLAETKPVFALVNFCLFAYNMLPFYPLDGGRIFRAVLHLLLPDRAAAIFERVISLTCLFLLLTFACYLTCVWHAGLWPVIVCALLLLRVGESVLPEMRGGIKGAHMVADNASAHFHS